MGWAFVAGMTLHALVHLLGFVKAFDFAAFPN